jgi:hypothetical protein
MASQFVTVYGLGRLPAGTAAFRKSQFYFKTTQGHSHTADMGHYRNHRLPDVQSLWNRQTNWRTTSTKHTAAHQYVQCIQVSSMPYQIASPAHRLSNWKIEEMPYARFYSN